MSVKAGAYRHDYYMRRKANGGKPLRSVLIKSFPGETHSVDLQGRSLKYGDLGEVMYGKVQSMANVFENEYYTDSKQEHMILIDENGNIVRLLHGGKDNVDVTQITPDEWGRAMVLTHNHPGNDFNIGGPLSDADVNVFMKRPSMSILRAAAVEGTYTMVKTPETKADAFRKAYTEKFGANSEAWLNATLTATKAQEAAMTGKMDFWSSERMQDKALNDFRLDAHEWLIDNQEKYGYRYALERRKT